MSELVQNLNEIYNVKLQIKSALETSSDQFSDYPSYINALKPSGYAYVTENGDYDVKSYAYVNVDCETLPEGYSYINQGTMVSLVNGNTVFEQYGLTKLQIDATQFGYFTNYKIQEEDEAFDNQTTYSITENGDYVVNPVRDSYCFRQKISVDVPSDPSISASTPSLIVSYNDGNTDIVEVLQPETSGTYTGSFLLPLPFDPDSSHSEPHFAYGYNIGLIDLNGSTFMPFNPVNDPDASPTGFEIELEDGNVQYNISGSAFNEDFNSIKITEFLITSELVMAIYADETTNYNLYLRVYKQGAVWKWSIINIPNS